MKSADYFCSKNKKKQKNRPDRIIALAQVITLLLLMLLLLLTSNIRRSIYFGRLHDVQLCNFVTVFVYNFVCSHAALRDK